MTELCFSVSKVINWIHFNFFFRKMFYYFISTGPTSSSLAIFRYKYVKHWLCKFKNQFIVLRHVVTFSDNLKRNYRIICSRIVTNFMFIYCHYKQLRNGSDFSLANHFTILFYFVITWPLRWSITEKVAKPHKFGLNFAFNLTTTSIE